ncbi:MAG: sensor histidine kinase [Candidatus Doudnabacteria bacterium]|nr:sensor histidine kinase [Candidatus Doudnabacteria bacterium]
MTSKTGLTNIVKFNTPRSPRNSASIARSLLVSLSSTLGEFDLEEVDKVSRFRNLCIYMQIIENFLNELLEENIILSPTPEVGIKVRHDIRQPLAKIMNISSVGVLFRDDQEALVDKYTAILVNAVEHLITTLDFSVSEVLSEEVDIPYVIEGLSRTNWATYIDPDLNPSGEISVNFVINQFVLDNPIFFPQISSAEFLRSLREPIINSAKYGATGVIVDVVIMSNGFLSIRYKDNGMGIEADRLRKANEVLKGSGDTESLEADKRLKKGDSTGAGLRSMVQEGVKAQLYSDGPNKGTTTLVFFSPKKKIES